MINTLITLIPVIFLVSHSYACFDSGLDPVTEYETGIKITLTETALSLFIPDCIDYVSQYIQSFVIPDISGSAVISDELIIDYDLSAIQITSISVDDASTVAVDDLNGSLVMTIPFADSTLTMNWMFTETTWPYVQDHGYANVDVNVQLQASFTFTQNECQTFDIGFDISLFELTNLNFDMHGGASWLYSAILNTLSEMFESVLSAELLPIVSQAAQLAIDKWADGLSPRYWFASPDGGSQQVYQDWRFTEPSATYGAGYFTVPGHGQSYTTNTDIYWQRPSPMPNVATGHDIQCFIDRMVFNSCFTRFQGVNKYIGEIEDPDNVLLQTNTLSAIIPGLADYPNDSLKLSIKSTEDPFATIMPTAVYVNMTGTMTAQLASTGEELFTVALSMGLACQLGVNSVVDPWGSTSYIHLVPVLYNQTATVMTSSISPPLDMTADTLQLIGIMLSEGVIPWLGDVFSYEGAILPESLYVNTEDCQVMFHDTYVLWASSLLFV
eukprot:gnl/Dysnectes_brevis/5565_a8061_461.p1 GENE.gnl/Dysnectes_brevis/5565_a8061_461~~gnl/Dysnectes_brevis/5565_a8061_461.p1  ORF type:complete len:515 (+),score=105.68 gnl/Dysnectes_brevis/5565_a8061_461:57-1547(+)